MTTVEILFKEQEARLKRVYTATCRFDEEREFAEYLVKKEAEVAAKARKKAKRHTRHIENAIANMENRRARIEGAGGSFTAKEWRDLKKKYGRRCLCCGRDDVKLTVDHIIPISMDGSNNIENIQPLCWECNSAKHTQTIDFRLTADRWTNQ